MAWPSRERLHHPVSGESYAALRDKARAMRAAGATEAAIMTALDVSKPTVWRWVRDLPCHKAVARANQYVGAQQRRLYPRGTAAYAAKLRRAEIPLLARIRLTQDAAR
ncbi:helix-turn-helix domain-containing protein [Methylobacterium sp. 1973]|uniref:helix-turn-helix domain-containing protein n=1 Tax=Methylobacterium sp. 1973 TaxID=3156421 RepID=UPI0033996338